MPGITVESFYGSGQKPTFVTVFLNKMLLFETLFAFQNALFILFVDVLELMLLWYLILNSAFQDSVYLYSNGRLLRWSGQAVRESALLT